LAFAFENDEPSLRTPSRIARVAAMVLRRAMVRLNRECR